MVELIRSLVRATLVRYAIRAGFGQAGALQPKHIHADLNHFEEYMMALLDWVVPGRSKNRLRQGLGELVEAAHRHAESRGMPVERARLWKRLTEAAAETVLQVFVKPDDRRIDLALRAHRGKVKAPELLIIYWWMILYQLVLFKNRGLDGYSKDEDFPALAEFAREFVDEFSAPFGFEVPGPWEERWRFNVGLEAALGIYNSIYRLLRLRNDFEKRITRVSLYTKVTEQAYDRMAQDFLAELGRGDD